MQTSAARSKKHFALKRQTAAHVANGRADRCAAGRGRNEPHSGVPRLRRFLVANRLVSVYGASPARHFDVRLGNPHNLSLAGCRGRAIQIRAANEFAQTVLPVIRAIQVAGTTSLASIADVLNERGIKSARGGKWHVSSVANVLSRTPG